MSKPKVHNLDGLVLTDEEYRQLIHALSFIRSGRRDVAIVRSGSEGIHTDPLIYVGRYNRPADLVHNMDVHTPSVGIVVPGPDKRLRGYAYLIPRPPE